jgi:D-arabinose 1-dehydrogenase-like Zn-dependent alcohol dehydrogenase
MAQLSFVPLSGHEFSGVIVETGKNFTEWKVRDRVVSLGIGYACGKCHACAAGDFMLCPERKAFGAHMDGGFTKYAKIPGQFLQINKNCFFIFLIVFLLRKPLL